MIRDFLTGPAGATLKRPAIDVAAVRARPIPALPWMVSAVAEVAAVALLAAHPWLPAAVLAAALLHVTAAVPLAVAPALTPSERTLAVALVLSLPLLGSPLALLALATVGRGEVAQPAPQETTAIPPSLDPEEARRLAEALPCCEALLAGTIEERRAILATLTRRADADALALLRWALAAPDTELAIEAALALEDVHASFEARLEAARRELRSRPAFEAAITAAEIVARAIDAGIAEPSLVPALAHEARGFFELAVQLNPRRRDAVALERARLELAVLRPDTALACIDEALAMAAPEVLGELAALRAEAVLATHVLPWEGPSALASYRPSGPPPLTARRRLIYRGVGTGRRVLTPSPDRGGGR
jgi:hypothetical protein